MWTFVPAQAVVQEFLDTFKDFPPTAGGSLSIDTVLKQLQDPPRN
jgi:arylsulfatase